MIKKMVIVGIVLYANSSIYYISCEGHAVSIYEIVRKRSDGEIEGYDMIYYNSGDGIKYHMKDGVEDVLIRTATYIKNNKMISKSRRRILSMIKSEMIKIEDFYNYIIRFLYVKGEYLDEFMIPGGNNEYIEEVKRVS